MRNRVLLVDDYPPLRMLVCEMLKERGRGVVAEAGDGREAVDAVDADPDGYRIVIMDLHMPVMDGFAATAAIRAKHPDVEVVAFSSDDAAERRSLEAGASRFFSKTNLGQLVDYVRSSVEPA
jgi:CheY-like chemotaxis protein